jgi:hypothetical protein
LNKEKAEFLDQGHEGAINLLSTHLKHTLPLSAHSSGMQDRIQSHVGNGKEEQSDISISTRPPYIWPLSIKVLPSIEHFLIFINEYNFKKRRYHHPAS